MSSETLKDRLRHIIFGTSSTAGKAFDISLIGCIIVSVIAVMLASVKSLQAEHGGLLRFLEWAFTIIFTIEYLLRIWIAENRKKYIFSFFGCIDLLAIIPTYVSVFMPGAEYLIVVRALRVLRVFRILKLLEFVDGSDVLVKALWAGRHKIIVFAFTITTLVVIIGSIMYVVESEEAGFTSIPKSIYWAIVTLSTVGYGDVSPQTPLGQTLAACVMLLGYAIIAVPTGIVTAELTRSAKPKRGSDILCQGCGQKGHLKDARFCRICGSSLE